MSIEPTAPAPETTETVVMNESPFRAGTTGPSVWHAPAVIAAFLVIALIAAGTGIALGASTAGDAAATATATAGKSLLGAPAVGTCYIYGKAQIAPSTNNSPAVACSSPHTAETFAVTATLPAPHSDGTWTDAQTQTAGDAACNDAITSKATAVQESTVATKRFVVAFFAPDKEQAKDGARWIRCDVVLLNEGETSAFSGTLKDVLATPGVFAICADPNGLNPTAVRCEVGKGQAVVGAAVDIPKGSTVDQGTITSQCRTAVASVTVGTGTTYATVPQYDPSQPDAQRVALCWLPVQNWKYANGPFPAESSLNSNVTSV